MDEKLDHIKLIIFNYYVYIYPIFSQKLTWKKNKQLLYMYFIYLYIRSF